MYRAMYKSELAEAAGVSRSTFRRWLQSDQKKLAELGIARHAKLLSPAAIKYLCEKYVIEL